MVGEVFPRLVELSFSHSYSLIQSWSFKRHLGLQPLSGLHQFDHSQNTFIPDRFLSHAFRAIHIAAIVPLESDENKLGYLPAGPVPLGRENL